MNRRGSLPAVLALTLLVLAVAGCATIEILSLECRDRFAPWAPGPEDIDLDTDHRDGPRLIVSVQERRVRNRDGSLHYQGRNRSGLDWNGAMKISGGFDGAIAYM